MHNNKYNIIQYNLDILITSSSSTNSSTLSGFFPKFLLIFLNSTNKKNKKIKKNGNKHQKLRLKRSLHDKE